eukprot:COSAG02_NODE_17_length_55377_cov_106.402258_19_plen_47_part_00
MMLQIARAVTELQHAFDRGVHHNGLDASLLQPMRYLEDVLLGHLDD